MKRRTLLAGLGAGLALPAIRPAEAATVVGVTKTEIKIGHIIPYSGNASSYGVIGKSHSAYMRMINDQGGINGRKINFISLDDAYNPSKTVEQARRLVEQDRVAFLFNTLGTPTNSAIHRYVNQRKVPHLFLSTGADKWADPENFPWTMGWQPSYRTEAQIYARYLLKEKPGTKAALIYQNDDFGKDYLNGVKDVLKGDFDKVFVKVLTYEATDATIDSQVVSLKESGAEALVSACIPKFSAQLIRKAFDIGWKPLHMMSNVSSSVGATINPAGPEKAVGVVSSLYLKDNSDPAWKDDKGMNEWRAFMAKYIPDGDLNDGGYVFSYGVCQTLVAMLKQCGDDLSRENILKQATMMKHDVSVLLPGISVSTGAKDYHPIKQMQLTRWTGTTWERFGGVLSAS